uniref:EF-hand domain-containing protein n=1 Tax=Lotharella oceanica TaxID=641309 RepID=A0A7S2TIJ3_9EUKA|mmetsp:Transcript_1538/g.2902  ORF Transcript_1538/g.2902 Transcript_1538/m.2902 type:complete len:128 (+) Transcript_1538:50-433(+)
MAESKVKERKLPGDAGRTTKDIEKQLVSKMFDDFDKSNTGNLDPNELPSLCMALDVKPWHVMRYVKTNKESKVTKEAFLEYWFDPSRPTAAPKKKKEKKATKADVVRAFSNFKEALKELEQVCLSAC